MVILSPVAVDAQLLNTYREVIRPSLYEKLATLMKCVKTFCMLVTNSFTLVQADLVYLVKSWCGYILRNVMPALIAF